MKIKRNKSQPYFSLVILVLLLLLIGLAVIFWRSKYHMDQIIYPRVKSAESVELLPTSLILSGNKSIAKAEYDVLPNSLYNKNVIYITYDMHGLCALDGDASSIILKQENSNGRIILAHYGKNCYNGEQTATIPISDIEGLDKAKPIIRVALSFWYPTQFTVEVAKLTIASTDKDVLGAHIYKVHTEQDKAISGVTPLRPFPFAKENQ